MFGAEPLSFERDGADWPNRGASQFVEAGGSRWHLQRAGAGPQMLMIHGTGASTHSWEALLPRLASRFSAVAPDLPGHGFTRSKRSPDLSLSGMAVSTAALVKKLDFRPRIVVGHSAGAAILARLCLDGAIAPDLFVSLNGAWLPFEGAARFLFPSIAKLLFLNPLAPRVFAWSADRNSVRKLLAGTGSTIDRRGLDLYTRLLSNPVHVGSALGMMANWNLIELTRELPRLRPKMLLIVGADDKAVPPETSRTVAALMTATSVEVVPHAGHLAHEEDPDAVAALIFAYAADSGVLGQAERCSAATGGKGARRPLSAK
jgi:magnesium chelatase accessory protein